MSARMRNLRNELAWAYLAGDKFGIIIIKARIAAAYRDELHYRKGVLR